jgi:hypothetical protein
MNMNIEIIQVKAQDAPRADGKGVNKTLQVDYRNLGSGKVEGKKLYEFATKADVYARLLSATSGEVFTVTQEKNAKGYWDWQEVARQDGSVAPSAGAAKANYEERDNKRQQMIIRQSSLSSAVALVKPGTSVDEVIMIAKRFVDFVNEDTRYADPFADMSDDLPV